jgi:transposase
LVDTLGLPLSIAVTSAGVRDTVGAWRPRAGLKPLVPRLTKVRADGAYTSKKLARWCERYGRWDLEIVGRDPEARGFAVQPRRWVVEPGALRAGFAWLVRNRRLRIDYERKPQTSEALIEVAMIRILLQRLAKAT